MHLVQQEVLPHLAGETVTLRGEQSHLATKKELSNASAFLNHEISLASSPGGLGLKVLENTATATAPPCQARKRCGDVVMSAWPAKKKGGCGKRTQQGAVTPANLEAAEKETWRASIFLRTGK